MALREVLTNGSTAFKGANQTSNSLHHLKNGLTQKKALTHELQNTIFSVDSPYCLQVEAIILSFFEENTSSLAPSPNSLPPAKFDWLVPLVDLTFHLYRVLELDSEKTLQALRWCVLEVLGPFYDVNGPHQMLLLSDLINDSANAIGLAMPTTTEENESKSEQIFQYWLQSMFTSCATFLSDQDLESIWTNVFQIALQLGTARARRFLVSAVIAFVNRETTIDALQAIEALWETSQLSYETIELDFSNNRKHTETPQRQDNVQEQRQERNAELRESEYDVITSAVWLHSPKVHKDENILLFTRAALTSSLSSALHGEGNLYVTSYRVIFFQQPNAPFPEFEVPLLCISHIELTRKLTLRVSAKDVRKLQIHFSSEHTAEKVFRQLSALLRHDPLKRAMFLSTLPQDLSGWSVYHPLKEFRRMGLAMFPHLELFEQENYNLCSTYPRYLVLPHASTHKDRFACAAFRSQNRLPVVTWVSKTAGTILARCAQPLTGLRNATSGADQRIVRSLMKFSSPVPQVVRSEPNATVVFNHHNSMGDSTRSVVVSSSSSSSLQSQDSVAQFMTDMWSKVNRFMSEDSSNDAAANGSKKSSSSSRLAFESSTATKTTSQDDSEDGRDYIIMDSRSQIASIGNQMLGKGTENPANYPGAELMFLNIDNIHVVRSCFHRLSKLAAPTLEEAQNFDFYKAVAETGWLKQVLSVLSASVSLADTLENKRISVLTHCSDGWDRTAQMCSLSMLMLDGYYRTRKGFAILIEKEWCSFGHKFMDRFGSTPVTDKSHKSEERSPVFTLFIDCVWQMMIQFPQAFEFNEEFLVALLDHVTSGRFGTFLFNSERERVQHGCFQRTASVWSLLLKDDDQRLFLNQAFDPSTASLKLFPRTTSKSLRLWERYYFRFDPTFVPASPLNHHHHNNGTVRSRIPNYV